MTLMQKFELYTPVVESIADPIMKKVLGREKWIEAKDVIESVKETGTKIYNLFNEKEVKEPDAEEGAGKGKSRKKPRRGKGRRRGKKRRPGKGRGKNKGQRKT